MTLFEKLIKENYKLCDICKEETLTPMYGMGWDYDKLICLNKDCDSEIQFSTSTICEVNK